MAFLMMANVTIVMPTMACATGARLLYLAALKTIAAPIQRATTATTERTETGSAVTTMRQGSSVPTLNTLVPIKTLNQIFYVDVYLYLNDLNVYPGK